MSLNHIKLAPSVIAGLYHFTLIDTQEITPKSKKTDAGKDSLQELTSETGWKYLGENRKNILIAINHSDFVHLPDEELNFLTGILGACKLSIGDVAIVNFNNHPQSSYKDLKSHFKSKNVFLFDVEPATFGLPMSFPHFQIQTFANSSFLFAPSLKELEQDKLLKSKLWICLKRIFGI